MTASTTVPAGTAPSIPTQVQEPQDLRLQCLQTLCTEVAQSINTALCALRAGAEDASVAYLVCDALERAGWMAERAAGVAHGHGRTVGICGGAEGWMLPPGAEDLLRSLEAAESKEVAHG